MQTQKTHVSFPWKNPQWDKTLAILKKWNLNEQNVDARKKNLAYILVMLGVKNPRLSVLHSTFYTYKGPIDLMIKAIINGDKVFPNGQVCTQTSVASVIKITKFQAFILQSLYFFNLLPGEYATMLANDQFILCIANYFEHVWKKINADNAWAHKIIMIERRVLGKTVAVPNWIMSVKKLNKVTINTDKKGIEDFRDSAQVNFADPKPGGTLPSANADIVQEEILFLIYPELFITQLTVPNMEMNEAVIVSGVTRTNNYTGYKQTFRYTGDFSKDDNDVTIIFIDATRGHDRSDVKRLSKKMNTDLNKAFLGFSANNLKSIATGHWGCGAFGGNYQFMSIIQLLAAAQAEKSIDYTMYGEPIKGFQEFYNKLVAINANVGEIYSGLMYAVNNKYEEYYDIIIKVILTLRKKNDK
uniref:PARG catalytic Macro domain-containing protein n=1 Tax=viral metagenome TaxID=1070528 RepID=A0A6C0C6K5_9ZZZZ